MKNIFHFLNLLIFLSLFHAVPLSAQIRKDLFVTIQPASGVKNVYLLFCSAEEHSSAINASSVFTTRLPTLPLRLNKWEESIFILPGRKAPMQKIRLIDDITFTYPLAGICRKAFLEPDPEEKGAFRLSLYWYEGKMDQLGQITSFRVWGIVSLKPGIPAKLGSMEIKK